MPDVWAVANESLCHPPVAQHSVLVRPAWAQIGWRSHRERLSGLRTFGLFQARFGRLWRNTRKVGYRAACLLKH